jgi:hypothetical protein
MTLEHFDTILAFVLVITGVSLLITALNQMVSAVLGLRGTHLRWGIKTLLANMDPSLQAHAEEISKQVLHHPLISDSTFSKFGSRLFSRWKLANAIRKDELIEILKLLVKQPPGSSRTSAKEPWASALEKALDELDPQAANDVVLVAKEVKRLFPNDPAKVEQLVGPLMDSAADLSTKISQWFDSVMDRSSQRFALEMRVWTIVFAVIVAFGLQLDAFSLFTRLSTDAQLRAQVLASSDALTKHADELGSQKSTNASPAVYILAMKQLIADYTNELTGFAVPAGFATQESATNWLAGQLKKQNIPDPDNQWVQKYQDLIPEARLRAASDNLNSLISDKLIFTFVPSPYPAPFYREWYPGNRVFWGIIASAVLLSLGAPFWFNVLKGFSNLQPVVAKKEKDEVAAGGAA